jgi:hypothetical protein
MRLSNSLCHRVPKRVPTVCERVWIRFLFEDRGGTPMFKERRPTSSFGADDDEERPAEVGMPCSE